MTTPTLEEMKEKFLQDFDGRKIQEHRGNFPKGYISNTHDWFDKELDTLISTAKREALREVKDYVEAMPAFTSTSDKTMSKVSDKAKKPAYGTNHLERETLLTHLESELTV